MTLLALACLVIVAGAAVSILARDAVPVAQSVAAAPVSIGPSSNKEGKKDRLAVTSASFAFPDPDRTGARLAEPLRQAFASDSPLDPVVPKISAPIVIPSPVAPQKPKLVSKPPTQKSYSLLSDTQIAAIKGRLKLSAAQEQSWPAVEDALRAVARKIHDSRRSDPNPSAPIDPESPEVQQLKSAALPLLFQLREDQKREVRALARLIGLEAVASRI